MVLEEGGPQPRREREEGVNSNPINRHQSCPSHWQVSIERKKEETSHTQTRLFRYRAV